MAGSIQGLTVRIGGDVTSLSKAMRQLRAEATTLKGHLATVGRALRFDPSSQVLITRQQQLLNAAMAQTQARLATLRRAHAEYSDYAGAMTQAEVRQMQRLQREISETELRYLQLRSEAVAAGTAMSASALSVAGRAGKISESLSKVSSQLLALSAVSAYIGYRAVKSAYDFESSFAGVRKTIIATEDEYDRLARKARDLALVNPVDVNDINRIMELGGQLNIATEYLVKFADTMARLDVSTDMGLEEGSMQLAQFMNITNMGQADVDRLGAAIVDLGNNSATTESQIMLMAMRIAGSGSNIGMTAGDILGMASALSALGIRAEMGGNAISTIMNRIDKDVANNSATLSTWAATAGMSADQFREAWGANVTDTLLQVIRGMGTFRDEGGNLNTLLKDMGISYMRQIDTMQRLSRSYELTEGLIARGNTAMQENTALVRESAQRYDTAASKMQLMKNAVNEAGIAIGQEILPAFKDLVVGATDAVEAFAAMDDASKSTVVTIGGTVIAAGLLVKAVQKVSGGISAGIGLYASWKTSLAQVAAAQMTLTDMQIVSTAMLDADSAAKLANAAATAAEYRELEALWKAEGNVALATEAAALAEEQEAAASGLASAARARELQSTGILAVAKDALTASTMRLAVALGISNAAALGIYAAAAVAAAAVVLLGKAFLEATDPARQLTGAAREQRAALDSARSAYDEAVAAHGAGSEEAARAKAALDEESDAWDGMAKTLGEFCENMSQAREENEQLIGDIHEATEAAQSQAGALLAAADRIGELGTAASRTAEEQAELAALINTVNQQVEGLDLVPEDIDGAAGAWRALVDEQARSIQMNTAMEQYSKLLTTHVTLAKNAADAQSEFDAALQRSSAHGQAGLGFYELYDKETQSYSDAVRDANAALRENEAEQRRQIGIMRDAANQETALKAAVGDVSAGTRSAAEAAAYYSDLLGVTITEGQIANARMLESRDAVAEYTDQLTELKDGLQDLCAEYPQLYDALERAGIDIGQFAENLAAAGVSADDFRSDLEDMVSSATDGMERLTTDSKVSLDEYIANLNANADAYRNWAANIRRCYEIAGDNRQLRDAVKRMADEGIENASLMQEAADGGIDKLQELADAFGNAADAASDAAVESAGAARRAEEDVSGSADATARAVESATAQAESYLDDQNRGFGDTALAAESASARISAAFNKYWELREKGRNAAQGFLDGWNGVGIVNAVSGTIRAALAAIRSAGEEGSPWRTTERSGRFAAQGLALGVREEEDSVREAFGRLAATAVDAADIGLALQRFDSAVGRIPAHVLYPQPGTAADTGAEGRATGDTYILNGITVQEGTPEAKAIKTLTRGVRREIRMRG